MIYRPPQDYWKVTLEPQPNCIDQSSTLLLAGIVNTLTDFLAVLLPIRTVVRSIPPSISMTNNGSSLILTMLSVFNQSTPPPMPHYLLPLHSRSPLLFRGYSAHILYVCRDSSMGSSMGFISRVGFCGCGAVYWNCEFLPILSLTHPISSHPILSQLSVSTSSISSQFLPNPKHNQICTSIPATKTFFATYIPLLFNSHPSRSSPTSRSLGRLAYHHHNSPENHSHNPGFNLNFNSKSHQNSAPRLGIASITKSNLKSHSHSESSMTPLSAATSFPDRDSIGSLMKDGDMRFFKLSTVTNSIRGGVYENTNEKRKMDEGTRFKSGIGIAVGSTSIASSNSISSTDLNTNLDKLQKTHNNSSSSSSYTNTIKRGFIGSMRREREPGHSRGCSRGQDKDRERERGTDRDWETENTSTSTPMDEESRRQGGSLDGSIEREKVRERGGKRKEDGTYIHINVVKTIEVEVEMEEEYFEEELHR